MESSMVTSADKYNLQIKEFIQSDLPSFQIIESKTHGPFFYLSLEDKIVKVVIQGDVGGFEVLLFIDGEKYPLWQYDKSVKGKTATNSDNIAYQLNIMSELLKSLSV